MQKRKGLLSSAFLFFLIWLMLVKLAEAKVFTTELELASIIYLICCIPSLIYFASVKKNIPYLPIFSIFYFAYFGLSIFNNYNLFREYSISPPLIIKALQLALAGIISLLVAFYLPFTKPLDSLFRPLKIDWDPQKAYRLGIILGIIGISSHYYSLTNRPMIEFGGLLNFAISLTLLAIAILFMLQLQNKLRTNGKIILWLGLFIPRILLELTTGATYPVLLDFVLLFLLYFYYFKSIPLLRLILVAALFFAIFSARNEYRALTWGGGYTDASVGQKVNLYLRLIYERASGSREHYAEAYKTLSVRTDYLATFVKIVELTPAYVPFWNGYTYSSLLTSFIPRFILPDKPTKNLGQEFGHRYMLLAPTDTGTSYNLPVLIEMYINFGELGVIIGMFLLGLILRFSYILLNHPEAGEGGFLLGAMVFVSLLGLESDFSLIFGNIIQYAILFYFIIKRMKLSVGRIT
jgi:hypothetical protein